MERAHRTDYLVGADQNLVPDWLVKITFLGKVETVIILELQAPRIAPRSVSVSLGSHLLLNCTCL